MNGVIGRPNDIPPSAPPPSPFSSFLFDPLLWRCAVSEAMLLSLFHIFACVSSLFSLLEEGDWLWMPSHDFPRSHVSPSILVSSPPISILFIFYLMLLRTKVNWLVGHTVGVLYSYHCRCGVDTVTECVYDIDVDVLIRRSGFIHRTMVDVCLVFEVGRSPSCLPLSFSTDCTVLLSSIPHQSPSLSSRIPFPSDRMRD